MRQLAAAALLTIVFTAAPGASDLKANRIIVRVSDLKASVAFYKDRVGLPLQSVFDEFAVLGGGDGVTVMLQQVERKSNGPGTGLAALTEVVLESPDVMKAYQEMKARGVVFSREPFAATTDGPRVLYVANFRDPDGHILSVTGWLTVR